MDFSRKMDTIGTQGASQSCARGNDAAPVSPGRVSG